mmetsp:Transcript_5685/g.18302  ORF Transcript_5685/g.18302 Transcript_5685/m.18302 type:complete len:89 (-) Transcript_5685:1487-1753(-)
MTMLQGSDDSPASSSLRLRRPMAQRVKMRTLSTKAGLERVLKLPLSGLVQNVNSNHPYQQATPYRGRSLMAIQRRPVFQRQTLIMLLN